MTTHRASKAAWNQLARRTARVLTNSTKSNVIVLHRRSFTDHMISSEDRTSHLNQAINSRLSLETDHFGLADELKVKNPVSLLREWYLESRAFNETSEKWTELCTLSTIESNCRPRSRIVSICDLKSNGTLVIGTDYSSSKVSEIQKNPRVCLSFNWPWMQRTVRIEGMAIIGDGPFEGESDTQWRRRPGHFKQWSLSKDQCRSLDSFEEIDQRMAEITQEEKIDAEKQQKPQHWGVILIQPRMIEFYQMSNRYRRFRFSDVSDSEFDLDGDSESRWDFSVMCP